MTRLSHPRRCLYQPAGPPLVRAAALPLDAVIINWPDPDDAVSCRAWLARVWCSEDGFPERVRMSHPLVHDRVTALLAGSSGGRVADKDVRKLARTIGAYLLREVGRPTPFGLWAGVAPAAWGPARAELGYDHRAVARPDAGWLNAVVVRLEALPELLDELWVGWDNRAVVRGRRVILHRGLRPVAVWDSAAVRAVRAAAAVPARFGDVVAEAAAAAGAPPQPDRARAMATELVRLGFLITSLRAPASTAVPLRHLIGQARAVGADRLPQTAPLLAALDRVAAGFDAYNHASPAEVQPALLTELAAVMGSVAAATHASRSPLMVDVRLDCDVALPNAVGREMARAADALLRLTREPTGDSAWRAYHRSFLDRFGIGALVPLLDLVDPDAGLGYPGGYPGSIHPPAAPPAATDRDARLLARAWAALADGSGVVVLTETDLDALAPDGPGPASVVPAHVEIAARVQAPSLEALNCGEFTLTVSPARAAGILTSRFTAVAAGSGLEEIYRSLPVQTDGALPVQLVFPAALVNSDNITRVPAYLPHLLPLGEPPLPADAQTSLAAGAVERLDVADLAVLATTDALLLVHRPSRRVVEPRVMHALAVDKQAHPLVRFLDRIVRAFGPRLHQFDWGPAAAHLPHLPRVRYGRSILAPARWRLTPADLTRHMPGADDPAGGDHSAWDRALHAWRHQWDCPDIVELDDDTRSLRLDLAEPFHGELLRAHLARAGHAVLSEAVPQEAYGWINRHVHQIAAAMTTTAAPHPTPRIPSHAIDVTDHGIPPGSRRVRWLSATLFAHPDRHNEIITGYLPHLLALAPDRTATDVNGRPTAPGVWFVRYRGPGEGPHLRIRIPTWYDLFGTATRALALMADHLIKDRVASGLRIDTYRPETGRYGSGDAMSAAERVFAADTHTVIAQLGAPPTRTETAEPLPGPAVVAAGMAATAAAFLGPAQAAQWLATQPAPAPDPTAPNLSDVAAQAARRHAVALARFAFTPGDPPTEPPHTTDTGRKRTAAPVVGAVTWSPDTAAAWSQRADALAAYRLVLPDDMDPHAVARALMHMHHNRAHGIDPDHEAWCWRTTCHAARAHLAHQTGGGS